MYWEKISRAYAVWGSDYQVIKSALQSECYSVVHVVVFESTESIFEVRNILQLLKIALTMQF